MINRFNQEVSYLFLKDELNITYPDGNIWTVCKSEPVFDKVLKAITANKNVEYFKELQKNALSETTSSDLYIKNDEVYFQGQVVSNQSLRDYVMQLNQLGISLSSIEGFLRRLYKNTSFNVKSRLFDYLKSHKLSLNVNGFFYAYVCSESRYVEGDVISFERGDINDSPLNVDKSIYDASALEVIAGNKRSALSTLYLCAVSPEDVVSVPYVFSKNKLRVCKYEVISECSNDVPVNTSHETITHNVSYVVDVLGVDSKGKATYSIKSMHNKISDAVSSFNNLCEKVDLFHEVRICSLNAGEVIESKVLSTVDIDLREEATTSQLSLELPDNGGNSGENNFIVVELDTNSVLAENMSQEESLSFALEQRNSFGAKVKVVNRNTQEVCISLT